MDEKEELTNKEEETEHGYDSQKGLFHIDNPLSTALTKLGSLILVNILFIVCCIPIITIGASVTALIKVCWTLYDERDVKIVKTFFMTFGPNFLDSTICWLIGVGIAGGCIFGGYNAVTLLDGAMRVILTAVCGFFAIMALIMLTYAFVLIARYDNTIVNQIKNALKIGFAKLIWTIFIWVIWAVPILAFAIAEKLVIYLGWLWLLVGFAALEYACCSVYRKILLGLEKRK